MDRERVVRGLLLVGSLVLVVCVRILPLSLGAVDDRAERVVREQVRERVGREISQSQPQPNDNPEIERRVAHWIAENPTEFARERGLQAAALKSQLRYEGKDGREYVYLGDYDSYLWLRHARNYLRTGTTCDAIVNGDCRDTYAHAPVGRHDGYSRSLHIAAIVLVYRIVTVFDPDYPLPASAFLVTVIIGGLGVFPAFAIGRRLGGELGGLCVALLSGLNPIFLLRSLGSDNDVWNVVLPLFTIWAAITALTAVTPRRQSILAICAGLFTALHAATWRGWVFTHDVLLVGLFATTVVLAVRHVMRSRNAAVWQGAELRGTLLVLVVYYVAAGVLTTLAGSEESYWRAAAGLVESVIQWPLGGQAPAMPPVLAWPSTFATVSELARPSLGTIAESMGGARFFFIGWLGLVILIFPRHGWKWWHFALLIAGNYLHRYLLTVPDLSRSALIALLTLPLGAAIILHIAAADDGAAADTGGGLIVVVWLLAALFLAYGGNRFVMLVVPPFAIAFGAAIGRLHTWLVDWLAAQSYIGLHKRGVVQSASFVLFATILVVPVEQGFAAARTYLPMIDDAWADTLTAIRDHTPQDAIVNVWWDYGYWAKYVADRRVSADGGSLATKIPYWLAHAALVADEGESIGLLRMLNCGSDARPLPEGRLGAFGKIAAHRADELAAYATVVDLARLDQPAGGAYLAEHGFSAAERADILESTHCTPPPAYLVLSSEQASWLGFRRIGSWDARTAYIAEQAKGLPENQAIAQLTQRFGYSADQAQSSYRAAAALRSDRDVQDFVAPHSGYLTEHWLPCQLRNDADMTCAVGVHVDPGTILETFVYRLGSPADSRLQLRHVGDDRAAPREVDGTPRLMLLASDTGMETVSFQSPTYPNLAVLVDLPNNRILIGPPYLITSVFTQLMYLDGRYAQYFEKFGERTGYRGERVVTWRINWAGRNQSLPETHG